MLGGLVRFMLFRVLGAKVMLAFAAFGFLRKLLGGRRTAGRPVASSRSGSRSESG